MEQSHEVDFKIFVYKSTQIGLVSRLVTKLVWAQKYYLNYALSSVSFSNFFYLEEQLYYF